MEIKNIIQDIKTVIKKEGKDELRYELTDEKTLVIEVIEQKDWMNSVIQKSVQQTITTVMTKHFGR